MALTQAQCAAIIQGAPVAVLRGDEAPRGYPLLRAWATCVFEQFGSKVTNPDLGEVVLDGRSVRNSMAHGMNPAKAVAFAAAKDVIERGALVVHTRQGSQDSFYVNAPVHISDRDSIVTILVCSNQHVQRMYLHSVATKEYLLKTKYSGTDANYIASGRISMATSGEGQTIADGIVVGKVSSAYVARALRHLLTLEMIQ